MVCHLNLGGKRVRTRRLYILVLIGNGHPVLLPCFRSLSQLAAVYPPKTQLYSPYVLYVHVICTRVRTTGTITVMSLYVRMYVQPACSQS
jgi:hypothetical protein